jgi:hypothetical protein
MADYTISDLRAAVINACPKCTKQQIGRAMAISLAENPARQLKATNTNTDARHTVDRGPFQINNYWHREVPDSCAFDLGCSAAAAYKISGGFKSFSQWSTNKGITQASIDAALKGAEGGDNADSGAFGTGVGSPTGLPNPLKGIDLLATSVERFVEGLFNSATWFRVGKVLVGLFLGGAGIIILARKAGVNPPLPIPIPV